MTPAGYVGIGTPTPIAPLEVFNPTTLGSTSGSTLNLLAISNTNGNVNDLNVSQIRYAAGPDWTTATTRMQQITDVTNQGYIDFNPAYGNYGLAFGSGSTEYVRISYGGNVGIGTTAPSSLLYVNGSAGGTQAWAVSSDGRLKTNVQTIPDALARVMKLRGVSFDWKPADARDVDKNLKLPVGKRQLGFIAQEVEAVAPEAVSPPKDSKDIYSLRPTDLIPLLVEALKAQQAEITVLRGRLDTLEHGARQ